MTFTKLELFLCDTFERVILNSEIYDPDQEIYNFLVIVAQTPESQINQRYLQILRTLRHDNYNIRSGAAKFLCIISYRNLPLQNRLRQLLPITILTTNLLVFNLPTHYSKSTLAELQKDVTKSDGSTKETVFWHFPSHYLETAEPPPMIDENLHPEIQAMLELKLDPLYQFIGSFTTAKRLRQYRNKPGLLEETLASRFSAPSKGPSQSLMQGLRHTKPRFDKEYQESGSISHRPHSTNISSPLYTETGTIDHSPLSVRAPSYTYTENEIHVQDDEDDKLSFGGNKKTPKFSGEPEKKFWMPKLSLDSQNRPASKTRSFKKLSQPSSTNNRSISPQEINQGSTTAHSLIGEGSTRHAMTVLDILQKTPEEKKEIRPKLSRSNSPYLNASPTSRSRSTSFKEQTELSRENSRVLTRRSTNKATEKIETTAVVAAKEKQEAVSEMTRETRRLLMFDRADIYKDYDKQVEMLGLRPFKKEKFEKKSYSPANVLHKVPLPKTDRKKAFVEFLNRRGKDPEPNTNEGKTVIKGNTFHGRKWKSHMTKARISNFGPKENYAVLVSATHAGLDATSRRKSPGSLHRELDEVGENLRMDVASSEDGYLKNIMDFTELGKKAYGDKLIKYLDVLNFEKANYNALDGEKIEEALELVDIIYEARDKNYAKIHKISKSQPPIREEEEDSYEEKLRRQELDLVYDRPVKMVPPSRLYIKRNSITSLNWNEERKSTPTPQKRMKRAVSKVKAFAAFGNLKTERTMSSESMVSGYFPSDMRHTNMSFTSSSIKNS